MRSSPNRVVGLVVGAGFIVLGTLGFFVNPIATLSTNLLQNIVHLLIGGTLVVCALVGGSAWCNAIVGTLLLAIGIAGLFIISGPVNVLNVNSSVNLLHFASAACLLAVGLGARPDKRKR